MKQLTDTQLINLLSTSLIIVIILFGIMVYYFRNEAQHLIELLDKSFKREQETLNEWYEKCKEANDDNLRLIKEKSACHEDNFHLLEEERFLIDFNNKLKNKTFLYHRHNKKYSTICRRLYDENNNLKMDVQGLESLFVDMKNKANEFELKIAELEKGKLKKRRKRL